MCIRDRVYIAEIRLVDKLRTVADNLISKLLDLQLIAGVIIRGYLIPIGSYTSVPDSVVSVDCGHLFRFIQAYIVIICFPPDVFKTPVTGSSSSAYLAVVAELGVFQAGGPVFVRFLQGYVSAFSHRSDTALILVSQSSVVPLVEKPVVVRRQT